MKLFYYIDHPKGRTEFFGEEWSKDSIKHNAIQHFDAIELKSGEEKTLYDWNDKVIKSEVAV